MRILMVTPYPPLRDGIANYAVQEVRGLRAGGEDVEVLSPRPSAAHHHLALRGWRGPLALAKRVAAYDRVIVQFHPDVFYPIPLEPRERTAVTAGLVAMARRAGNVEFRVHEVNHDWGCEPGRHASLMRMLWRSAAAISVHTEEEKHRFVDAFGVDADKVSVVEHGGSFVTRTALDREGARGRLGIAADETMFLSIGFIQPHKGFDRAVRAFAALDAPGTRLDVVGSVRVEDPAFVAYLGELRALVAATPGAHLHEGYVGDERFDEWIVACDFVVLPYRYIWSSGVLERARLYGRPVIATRVGGLEHQATGGAAVLVDDDDGLAAAMRRLAGLADPERPPSTPWTSTAGRGPDAERVQAEVRARAGASGDAGRDPAPGVEPDGMAAGVAPPREEAWSPFDSVGGVVLPPATAGNPAARLVKRLVRKLTAWELQPLADSINELTAAGRAATREPPPDH
jgi:glycosyltransferase involved in cell wall biosynthesis